MSSSAMLDCPILAACFICGRSFSSSQVSHFEGCKALVHKKCMTPEATKGKNCPLCKITHENAKEGRVLQLSNVVFPKGNIPKLDYPSGAPPARDLLETILMLIDQKSKIEAVPNNQNLESELQKLKRKHKSKDDTLKELLKPHKELLQQLHKKLVIDA